MMKLNIFHTALLLVAPQVFALEAVYQDGLECQPVYTPFNLKPTVYDYIDFDQAPLSLGSDPTQYFWYSGLSGGSVSGSGLFNSTTSAPGAVFSNKIWPVPLQGEIQASATFSYSSSILSGSVTSPLGILEDPFYGSAIFGVFDVVEGWQFAIIATAGKVYAGYGRVETPASVAANAKLFSYLVPIYTPLSADPQKYSIVLNSARFTASYRVNGEEKLLVQNVGKPIDNRFLISCGIGFNEGPAFPQNLQIVAGNLPLSFASNGVPNTACQRSIFNLCTQSPYMAYQTFCQYAPLQNPAVPVDIEMLGTFEEWSLVHWELNQDCHDINRACQQPDLYCAIERPDFECPCATVDLPDCRPTAAPTRTPCPLRAPCHQQRRCRTGCRQ